VTSSTAGRCRSHSQPGVGVDLLGHHQRQPGGAQALPQADQDCRQRAGQDDVADQLAPAEPEHLAQLGQPAVHAADAGERVQYSGTAAASATSVILGDSPMPNHTMNTGISPNSAAACAAPA
jgi:hypothetical protein